MQVTSSSHTGHFMASVRVNRPGIEVHLYFLGVRIERIVRIRFCSIEAIDIRVSFLQVAKKMVYESASNTRT
jgi:hypothetical protein